jgi:hypothetical protein
MLLLVLFVTSCNKKTNDNVICNLALAPLYFNFIQPDSSDVFVSGQYSLSNFTITHPDGHTLIGINYDTSSVYYNGRRMIVIGSQDIINYAIQKVATTQYYFSFSGAKTDTLTIVSENNTSCITIGLHSVKYNGVEIQSSSTGEFPLNFASRIILQ